MLPIVDHLRQYSDDNNRLFWSNSEDNRVTHTVEELADREEQPVTAPEVVDVEEELASVDGEGYQSLNSNRSSVDVVSPQTPTVTSNDESEDNDEPLPSGTGHVSKECSQDELDGRCGHTYVKL